MDIKSRDIRYAAGMKATAVVLVWLSFISAFGSWAFIMFNQEIMGTQSYYDTWSFKNNFSNMLYNVVKANIGLKSVENINASGRLKAEKESDIEHYYFLTDRLSENVNFFYYIRNTTTGEAITNINAAQPLELILKQPVKVQASWTKWKTEYNVYSYRYDIVDMLREANSELYAAIQEPLKPGDVFYDDYISYSRIKALSAYVYPVLGISIALLVLAAAYLAYVAGRKEKGGAVELTYVDRIYTDIHTVLVLIAAIISVLVAANNFNSESTAAWVGLFVVLGIDAIIGISYVLSMIRQLKAGVIFRNSLLYNLVRLCFGGRLFKSSVILFILGYGLINGILFAMGTHIRSGYQIPLIFGLFLAFNGLAVYFTAKALRSLSHIMKAAKEISSGNLDYAINSSEISVAFSGMAQDIENIQGGLKKAVAEAVKGERMKTELITNVSHDLKTPLTSIVNYVDLLKKEELDNEKAEEYINILEEKSARLKQLVEDLVEASKASSGNLPVNAEKVDLHELVLQAVGEYEEKIGEAGLDLRINAEEKNTYVYADGKQMWRIIDNLLINAIKYSMPQSRIYVNLSADIRYGTLTIKNISAFPLDIPPEQLTERFVRGDVSRSTEGSGLGLSIAQSLTLLQGGNFKIDIDGDLFKVTVDIPLWTE